MLVSSSSVSSSSVSSVSSNLLVCTHLRKEGNVGTEELDELGDNGRECCMARAKRP